MPIIFDTCGSLLQIFFLLIYSFDSELVKGCLFKNMGSNLPCTFLTLPVLLFWFP